MFVPDSPLELFSPCIFCLILLVSEEHNIKVAE